MGKTKKIAADGFASAVGEAMQEISDEKTKKVFELVDEAAEKCSETAQQHLYEGHGVKTGRYKKHFAVEKETLSKRHHRATWYVEKPEYRLQHLLEKGHDTRDGTKRTKPVKHIKYGYKSAEQLVKERMKHL